MIVILISSWRCAWISLGRMYGISILPLGRVTQYVRHVIVMDAQPGQEAAAVERLHSLNYKCVSHSLLGFTGCKITGFKMAI